MHYVKNEKKQYPIKQKLTPRRRGKNNVFKNYIFYDNAVFYIF